MNYYATHQESINPTAQAPLPVARGFRHHLSVATTLALVLTVALAGWLVTMQINQPGGSNDRFAGILGTPEAMHAQTCDVESLSVDRVMDIVRNPFPYMKNGPLGDLETGESLNNSFSSELREADWWDRSLIATGSKSIPSVEVFEESSAFANEYLACLLNGTLGQVWSFYSPISIQEFVLGEFPVFPNEEDVETYLEAKLNSQLTEDTHYFSWLALSLRSMDASTVTVNPERELALQQSMWSGTPNTFTIALGVEVTNSNGDRVYLSTGTGNELIRHEAGQRNLIISVAWNDPYGHWYILPLAPLSL